LFRPATSSKEAVWNAGKAWMTGTSPVKGTWSCCLVPRGERAGVRGIGGMTRRSLRPFLELM
jgi:hypothetical protein